MDINAYIEGLKEDLAQLASLSPSIPHLDTDIIGNAAWLRIDIPIGRDCLFSLAEVVDTEFCYPVFVDYKYQLLTERRVRFRYDCRPHHPDLPTFPEHKHNDLLEASARPRRSQFLREVWDFVETRGCGEV